MDEVLLLMPKSPVAVAATGLFGAVVHKDKLKNQNRFRFYGASNGASRYLHSPPEALLLNAVQPLI